MEKITTAHSTIFALFLAATALTGLTALSQEIVYDFAENAYKLKANRKIELLYWDNAKAAIVRGSAPENAKSAETQRSDVLSLCHAKPPAAPREYAYFTNIDIHVSEKDILSQIKRARYFSKAQILIGACADPAADGRDTSEDSGDKGNSAKIKYFVFNFKTPGLLLFDTQDEMAEHIIKSSQAPDGDINLKGANEFFDEMKKNATPFEKSHLRQVNEKDEKMFTALAAATAVFSAAFNFLCAISSFMLKCVFSALVLFLWARGVAKRKTSYLAMASILCAFYCALIGFLLKRNAEITLTACLFLLCATYNIIYAALASSNDEKATRHILLIGFVMLLLGLVLLIAT